MTDIYAVQYRYIFIFIPFYRQDSLIRADETENKKICFCRKALI